MDDMPISGGKQLERTKQVVNNEDLPIGGVGNKFSVNEQESLDDVPIKNGAYNLDNLGDDAFGGGPMTSNGNKQIKAPLSRFAAKAKPTA